MTRHARLAIALLTRMGIFQPETKQERHQRMCAECLRLLGEPMSNNPKDRADYETLRARWLASREQGC
jgi:hypothetical protein